MLTKVIVTVGVTLLAARHVEAQTQKIAPTEVLHRMIQEMLAHPDRPQGENTQKFLELADTTVRGRVERAALGEAYFLAFEPDGAKEVFRTLSEGTDAIARLAWKRLIRITFAAESRADESERMLNEFYRRFKPEPDDAGYGSQHARDLAGYWLGQGDTARALGFIVREYQALPLNGPYVGLTLPGRMQDVFAKAGRADEAAQLTRRALEGLQQHATREKITGNRYAMVNGIGAQHRAGVLHTVATGLILDLPGYDEAEYVRGRIFSTIQQLQGMLSSSR